MRLSMRPFIWHLLCGGREAGAQLFCAHAGCWPAVWRTTPALPAAAQAQAAKPVKMVVLGDSLSAGLGLAGRRGVSGAAAKSLESQRDRGRHDQCRGVRRHHLRRPRPARLVGPGRHRSGDPRTRRQRCAARHRSQGHPRRADGHSDAAEGAQDRGPAVRHARAAELRRRLCRRGSTRSIPIWRRRFGVPLYPFFLEGVATEAKLNQADGLHPTAEGVDVIVEEYPAHGRGISGHDICGSAVEKPAAINPKRSVFPTARSAASDASQVT